ncbi:PKD domain-containing protein [bacterium]|nr:PKD domain-containing protein [bacterium]
MIKYIITAIMLVLFILPESSLAQDVYTATVLYTIPWGNEPDKISSDFQTISYIGHNEIFEPGPWAISDSGILVVVEENQNGRLIMKFDQNGDMIVRKNLATEGGHPKEIAILNSNEVALYNSAVPQKIFILNTNLDLTHEILLPTNNDGYVLFNLTPTSQNSFWLAFFIIEKIADVTYKQYYKTEIFLDGTYSTPLLIWDDVSNTGTPGRFISPAGEPYIFPTDVFGDVYLEKYTDVGLELKKHRLNEQETAYEIIYTHTSVSDPGWENFNQSQNVGARHFVTWQGDFYTIHATDAGMVLTKYTLNHDPVCDLLVVTPMPYQGPSPAAIEFDASGTYDPNPDDELTFEWDFDGDGIFNEPVDDAYTGDQNHPTHEYTQNYEGFVTMRVTDNHEGECNSSVYINVVIQ